MILYFLVLVVVSYLAFLFTSNLTNPFKFTQAPFRKRQFQLGRAMAIASLASGIFALLMMYLLGLNERITLALYLCVAGVLIVPGLVKYRRRSIWR